MLLNWIPFQRKEAMYPRAPSLDASHQFTLSQVAPWKGCESRERWNVLFLFSKMSQNSIDNVLVLDAPVRRIDDDSQRPATLAAGLNVNIESSP